MKGVRLLSLLLFGVVALGFALGGCAPAAEAPAAAPAPAAPTAPPEPPFYEGKTIRIVAGTVAGAAFDNYSRLIARHMGRHIPGNPSVIVENMPGGGSIIAANYAYKVAKPDGLTIVNFNGGLVLQQIIGGEGIEFDARKFGYLGVPVQNTVICVSWIGRGWKTMADAIGSAKPIIFGSTGPGSNLHDAPLLLQEALGINLKLVSGFGGFAAIRLAAEKGEVDGGCPIWEGLAAGWPAVEAGQVIILGQGTTAPHPEFPKVPLLRDMAKTAEGRQLIDQGITHPARMTLMYALPPGTPPERLKTLRGAFLAAMKDPQLLEEAKGKFPIDSLPGEEIEKLVGQQFAMPEALRKKLAAILLPK